MNNYEEKEKKLENVLKRLNSMSNEVIKMNNDINSLNLEKNQLLGEKEESERNFHLLSQQHQELKSELEKINKDVKYKFGNQNNFSQKIVSQNQNLITKPAVSKLAIAILAAIFVIGFFVVGFDQGHIFSLVMGETAFDEMFIHELTHDLRHAAGFPCH